MHDNNGYIKELFTALLSHCQSQAPFNSELKTDLDESFISRLEGICNTNPLNESSYEEGQQLVERIIANYPHITPALNRDLLWLLGANCMHFLVDNEISLYQQIDEAIHEAIAQGEALSFQEAKANIMKLH
jgi:hypothetical protein